MYFGLDWILLGLGIVANFLCVMKSRWNFIFGFLACLCGLIVAMMAHQNGLIVYNILLMISCLYGFWHWSNKSHGLKTVSPAGICTENA